MADLRLMIPAPYELSPPQVRLINDAGVRQHILGRIHARNRAIQIIEGEYGDTSPGPPYLATLPSAGAKNVTTQTPPAFEPGDEFPDDDRAR
jgi:hypothetical protein